MLEELEELELRGMKLRRMMEEAASPLRDHLQETLVARTTSQLLTFRRILEEVSLPCRMMLEHFSFFMGDHTHSLGFKLGQFIEGRSSLIDFEVQEWGNVVLHLGSFSLKWRDEDYVYLFYPDKVMIKSKNRSNPDIFLSFSFSFNSTRVHERYEGITQNPQVEYWHEDLRQKTSEE